MDKKNTYTIDRIEEGFAVGINDMTGKIIYIKSRDLYEGQRVFFGENGEISIIPNEDEKDVQHLFNSLRKKREI